MNRLSRLLQLKNTWLNGRRCNPRKQRPAPRQPAWVEGQADETQDRAAGCGWFDSSWHLHQGLAVTEHATLDAVSNELPLDWWLAWQGLQGSRPVAVHPA